MHPPKEPKVQVPDENVPEAEWDWGVGPDGRVNFINSETDDEEETLDE